MSIYFLILSPLIIISCLLIITSKNSITSVLYLILVFILNSLCFLLLGAEFLSILIIIIYIGAISILFLFVIMMLNLRIVEVYNTLISYFPIASFLSIFFFFEFIYILKNDINFFSIYYVNNELLNLNIISYNLVISNSNLYLIGDLLFNSYSYLLILVGLILLLAMIGSIILTIDIQYHNVKNKKIKYYNNTRLLKTRISF
jgi:NADH-quinone oxidoreductase subunit J